MKSFALVSCLLAALFGSSVSSSCYSGNEHLIGGLCFNLVNKQLSYEDARAWCHHQNPSTSAYLATVPDQKTSNFLASYARTTFGNDGNFWIGLSRPTSTGRYTWDSGDTLGWANFYIQNDGIYVAESPINGKWNTFGTDAKFNFVCSYDPNGPPTYGTVEPSPTWQPVTATAYESTTAGI